MNIIPNLRLSWQDCQNFLLKKREEEEETNKQVHPILLLISLYIFYNWLSIYQMNLISLKLMYYDAINVLVAHVHVHADVFVVIGGAGGGGGGY